ncbi:hypothetical protein D3C75_984090 [compost metagenome]
MAIQEKEADLCTWFAWWRDLRAVWLGVLQLLFAGNHRIVSRANSFCADYRGGSIAIA